MKEKLKNRLKFVLGDDSGDGHGRTDTYFVKSNITVDKFREAHFKFADNYFDVAGLCEEYGESYITDEDIIDKMKKLNLWDEEFREDIYSEDFLNIWLKAVKVIVPDFKYAIVTDDKWDNVHSYGGKRSIGVPGYGLFE